MRSMEEMTSPVVRHAHHHNLRNRFHLLKTLGQGTYGKVKLAEEKNTGKKVAIKTLRKSKINSEQDRTRIRREIEIMATLYHPHIISVQEVFENRDKIVMVLEYASGGELYDHINDRQGLPDHQARRFFRQIVSAVHYLHQNGVVHRDLKLENILLDSNGNVKIGDFGLANLYKQDEMLSTFCGSPLYASPEIVNGQPYLGPEADAWSLGVLLYTLVLGIMPFGGADNKLLRQEITQGAFHRPSHMDQTDALDLIEWLLCVDPLQRATLDDVCNHWWVNVGYDFTPEKDPSMAKGREVNFPLLEEALQIAIPSSDDEDTAISKRPAHQKPILKKPLKGILKQPKDFSPKFNWELKEAAKNTSNSQRKQRTSSESSQVKHSQTYIKVVQAQNNLYVRDPSVKVYDSTKKPKRGILKNKQKHRYSGADSGCVIDDINISDYFTGEAILHSPVSSQKSSITNNDSCMNDIAAVLKALDFDNSYGCSTSQSSRNQSYVDRQISNESGIHRSSEDLPLDEYSSPLAQVKTPVIQSSSGKKPKGILKYNGKYSSPPDPSWRHSIGSQSSNSSADLLDFSYDSLPENMTGSVSQTQHWNQAMNEAQRQISNTSDEGYFNEDEGNWSPDNPNPNLAIFDVYEQLKSTTSCRSQLDEEANEVLQQALAITDQLKMSES